MWGALVVWCVMLRDRNTVAMVAAHWECSPKTVRRRIAEGSLPCLRIGGIIRITREQVEAYERGVDTVEAIKHETENAARFVVKSLDPFVFGRRLGGQKSWKDDGRKK